MNKRDAEKLLRGLTCYDRPDIYEYAAIPTEKEFTRFEAEFGIRLPKSYRTFISVFGPGELGRVFQIQSPYCICSSSDMAKAVRRIRTEKPYPWRRDMRESDIAVIQRLIPCAGTFYGDQYFWDPEDVTDRRNHEYGIYLHRHGHSRECIEKIAATFDAFITKFCLGRGYHKFFPAAGSDRPDKSWGRRYRRAKKKGAGKKKG